MRNKELLYFGALSFVFILSGCLTRTYPLTRDRIDQQLSTGNRGYLQGTAPSVDEGSRKKTRTTQVLEIEFGKPVAVQQKTAVSTPQPAMPAQIEEPANTGNRGFVNQEVIPETAAQEAPVSYEKYTVQKNDTLQKISEKFYGTTKKWKKIFNANKDALKAPNKIYPGQVINLPITSGFKKEGTTLAQPVENLK